MLVDEGAEDVVHHRLEGCQGVCQSEEHHHWFEDPITHFECRFKLIAIAYSHVIVSPSYINHSVYEHLCEICNRLGDKGKWRVVWNGVFIEILVILDRT